MRGRIAVIGAGVVGASIAYHATRAGWMVTLFDRAFTLRETSGSTQAWVWVQSKRPDHYAELSYLSRELYPSLERAIGPVEFSPTGGLTPIFTPDAASQAHHLIADQQAIGLQLEWLERHQVLRIEPALNPEILGAIYSPHDGNVNPLLLVPTLLRAAQRQGANLSLHTEVIELKPHGQGWLVKLKEAPPWTGDQVVVAAGNDTPKLLSGLGIFCPVRPVRGQILVTQPMAPLLNHTLSAMRQMQNGEILIGYSHEENESDRAVTLPYLAEAARLAVQWVPRLAQVPIVRTFAGIRVMPQDDLPILGPVSKYPGLSVAAMHSGYTLAPVVGQLAVEWLNGALSSLDLKPYRLDRFSAKISREG
jgi:glycine/D-amino acid oxidase-like deaminating enzyme